jgi:hypothetical protein
MKQLQLVEPFEFAYRVLDRDSMQLHGDFPSLGEVFKTFGKYTPVFSDGYVEKIPSYTDNGVRRLWRIARPEDYGRYAIIRVEDGYVFNHTDIDAEKKNFPHTDYRRKYDKYERANDLVRKKNNVKKIKKDWASAYNDPSYGWNGEFHEGYYTGCSNMSCHRMGHTHNEARSIEDILIEYGEEFPNIVRGRRRAIPTGWSRERAVAAYGTAKSWKHHSKRRKQWIPK